MREREGRRERERERAKGESKLHRQLNLHHRRKSYIQARETRESSSHTRVQSKRAIASYHFRITRSSPAHPRAIRRTHARYPPSGSFAATTADAAAVVVVEKTPPLKKSPPTLRPTSLRRTFVGRGSRGGLLTCSYHAADTHFARTRVITRIRLPACVYSLRYARSVVCTRECALPIFPSPVNFSRFSHRILPACVPRHADVPGAARSPSSGSSDFPDRRTLTTGVATP